MDKRLKITRKFIDCHITRGRHVNPRLVRAARSYSTRFRSRRQTTRPRPRFLKTSRTVTLSLTIRRAQSQFLTGVHYRLEVALFVPRALAEQFLFALLRDFNVVHFITVRAFDELENGVPQDLLVGALEGRGVSDREVLLKAVASRAEVDARQGLGAPAVHEGVRGGIRGGLLSLQVELLEAAQ